MTVTYIHKVPSASKMGAFLRLLAIWRGSVVKGIWKDLAAFCLMYTAISVSYRYCPVTTVHIVHNVQVLDGRRRRSEG